MANITFTEGSGLQDSIFGKSQEPIKMFLEKRGEAFEQASMLPELFNISPSNHWGEKFGAALLGAAITGATSTKFYGKTFSTLGADGKCLFAKEHPSALGKKKQSNLFADGFSNDALAAAESAMQDFRGDNEEVLDVAPTTILIPNEYTLKRDVFAAIGADKDPDTSNNGFNFNFGRWNVIVWPYLNQFITAGTKPWVLLDSKYNEEYGGAVWLDRVALEVRSELAGNDANVWKGYARFIAGFNDWRAFCVGGVTGGTQLIATSTGG